MAIISYKEASAMVPDIGPAPACIVVYYAYKGGSATVCNSLTEAKRISSNTAMEVLNKAELDEYWEKSAKRESEIVSIIHESMRKEFDYLTNDVFNICYDDAYDRGHHAGIDEVANYMYSVVSFAEKILKAASK